jgi:hypothetical protein
VGAVGAVVSGAGVVALAAAEGLTLPAASKATTVVAVRRLRREAGVRVAGAGHGGSQNAVAIHAVAGDADVVRARAPGEPDPVGVERGGRIEPQGLGADVQVGSQTDDHAVDGRVARAEGVVGARRLPELEVEVVAVATGHAQQARRDRELDRSHRVRARGAAPRRSGGGAHPGETAARPRKDRRSFE